MKVLLIHNRYLQSGGENITFLAEKKLLEAGEQEVITYERDNREIKNLGAIGRIGLAGRTLWARDSFQEVLQIIEQQRPDIAHFTNFFPLISPSAYYACQQAGVPVVQTLHNYRLLCPGATLYRNGRVCEACLGKVPWRGIIHRCYRNSAPATMVTTAMIQTHRWLGTWQNKVDVYITPTQFMRQKFIQAGLPPNQIWIKPTFLNADPGVRSYWDNYAVYVGRLTLEKGVMTLVRAWHKVSDVLLKIIGDGPLFPEIQKFIQENQLNNIILMGWLAKDEVIDMMKQARFLLVPSQWYEGFPLTVLEAFACALPVVVSDLGGLADLVENDVTGLKFVPGNAKNLQEKISWAISHPDEMEQIGKNGRKQYETYYTAGANYKQLVQIYNSILT